VRRRPDRISDECGHAITSGPARKPPGNALLPAGTTPAAGWAPDAADLGITMAPELTSSKLSEANGVRGNGR
jgi:hypothetical protein